MVWDPNRELNNIDERKFERKLNGWIREMGPTGIAMVWDPCVEWIWERMVANSQRMTGAGSDLTGASRGSA